MINEAAKIQQPKCEIKVFFKIILLEINMLKLHILTEKWSFLGDKTTNGRKCAGFGINDLGCGEGNFRSFGGGSVAHSVRYGMVECVPARMNKKNRRDAINRVSTTIPYSLIPIP